MMKVMLVEDEPSAVRYLKSIIDLRCEGFEVVAIAENGIDGLNKARELKPDVVITDIKMPGMNGIELTAHLKGEMPFIYSVIISGYQDFEYARGAIRSGVVDYLLKPININQLKALLDSIYKRLEEDYYERRLALLRQVLSDNNIQEWRLQKYLPFKSYSAAILRINGLPSRFPAERSANMHDIGAFSNIATGNSIWALQSRDEFEVILFSTPELLSVKDFEEMVTKAANEMESGYYTAVFAAEPFDIKACKERIAALYKTLDRSIILGKSQMIHNTDRPSNASDSLAVLDEPVLKRIDFFASNAMYDELKGELEKLLTKCREQCCSQISLETMLRQIFYRLDKHSVNAVENNEYNIEFLLDEAICYAADYDELRLNLFDIIERLMGPVRPNVNKIDSPLFFYSIENYIKQNLSQPLSLKSVCAKFGISQTYLSRLFRKYKNMSFNEYVTLNRIEEAKRVMLEHPDMLLKDVAELAGYSDPFYFSHVFRSITGMPPSKYLSNTSLDNK